MVLRGPH